MQAYGNVYAHFISKIKFQVSGLVFSEGAGGQGREREAHSTGTHWRLCLWGLGCAYREGWLRGVPVQDYFAKNTDETICLKYIGESSLFPKTASHHLTRTGGGLGAHVGIHSRSRVARGVGQIRRT